MSVLFLVLHYLGDFLLGIGTGGLLLRFAWPRRALGMLPPDTLFPSSVWDWWVESSLWQKALKSYQRWALKRALRRAIYRDIKKYFARQ